jgi:hypothetical protein
VYWTLVFTAASLEHLAERGIHAMDVTDAAYGKNGPARVRRSGRGARQRWFVVAPLETGDLLTCVFRAAHPRDLETEGAFHRFGPRTAGVSGAIQRVDALVCQRPQIRRG